MKTGPSCKQFIDRKQLKATKTGATWLVTVAVIGVGCSAWDGSTGVGPSGKPSVHTFDSVKLMANNGAAGGNNNGGGKHQAGGNGSGGTAQGGTAGTGGIDVPPGYGLVWSDEFDVAGVPNPANWTYETGFVRNQEAQWYQPENAWVENGLLIIEARREQKANPNYQPGSGDWKTNRAYAEYTSASLTTQGLKSWQFGRFEMRGRIVTNAGLWPAWWTLGVNGEWPSCGEVDVMEYYQSKVLANVACGTTTQWVAKWDSVSRRVSSLGRGWSPEFHVWRMDWNDQTIDLWLDNQPMNTTNLSDMLNPDGSSPFRQPHFMIANLAIGGTAGGDPSQTAFPTRYEIDYIRVFQAQ